MILGQSQVSRLHFQTLIMNNIGMNVPNIFLAIIWTHMISTKPQISYVKDISRSLPWTIEYVIPEFFDKADAFWQTQGHNEQKFARTRSWGHGNRLGPRYLYGSKMAHFPFIKTGYFVLFFHFDFWGTSNQQNWLIFSPDGVFSTAISNLVRLFFYLAPNRNYSTAKSRKPPKTPQKPWFFVL